jgi:hypothetical protein
VAGSVFSCRYHLNEISFTGDNGDMLWEVEVSDEFAEWYRSLDEDEGESVDISVDALAAYGRCLGVPMCIR